LFRRCPNTDLKSKVKKYNILKAMSGFYPGSLSWSDWNLEMLVFVEEGKPENPA